MRATASCSGKEVNEESLLRDNWRKIEITLYESEMKHAKFHESPYIENNEMR